MSNLDASVSFIESVARQGTQDTPRRHDAAVASDMAEANHSARALSVWLLSLPSFFNLRNHPFTDAERAEILTRDFNPQVSIVQQTLRHTLRLTLSQTSNETPALFDAKGWAAPDTVLIGAHGESNLQAANLSATTLSEVLADACGLCDALLTSPFVNYQAWGHLGRILSRELERAGFANSLPDHQQPAWFQLPPELQTLVKQLTPEALKIDLTRIFIELATLIEKLHYVEYFLRRDQPLKQTLPIFTLIHQRARSLVDAIETRTMRMEGLDDAIFDTLDRTGYAISMELFKVFSHELVGIASLRQAPPIYTKVENAHGLLRDSFQQAMVGLAQTFDPALDGARIFQGFRNKLDQSLALRRDLWTLLQLVRAAEKERDRQPVAPLLESLHAFQAGGLRYLMYKDWESYERFVEEVAAARGVIELTPVLHRLGTYLEALFGQINMRVVLAEHPFECPSPAE